MNDYTGWFAGDADMGGTYNGYDGPAPPWNDLRVHRYHFQLFALDIERYPVDGDFNAGDVAGHETSTSVHSVEIRPIDFRVSIDEPAAGLLTNQDSVTVRGSLSHADAQVSINGIAAAMQSTG